MGKDKKSIIAYMIILFAVICFSVWLAEHGKDLRACKDKGGFIHNGECVVIQKSSGSVMKVRL